MTAAVGAAVGASALTGTSTDSFAPALVVGVLVLSWCASTAPDSHIALVVIAVVFAQWVAVSSDPASGWSVPVAICLIAFHLLVALMATTPPSAVIEAAMLLRWLRRTSIAVAATVATWGLVAALDARPGAAGEAALLASLIALAAGARIAGAAGVRTRGTDDMTGQVSEDG